MKRAASNVTEVGRQGTPADRWLRRAAEFRARWLRSALPSRRPHLEFLRRASVSYNVSQRWQEILFHFYPQIHLVMQPLIREASGPGQRAETVQGSGRIAPREILVGRPWPKAAWFGASGGVSSQTTPYPANHVSPDSDSIDHVTALAKWLCRYTTLRSETSESSLELNVRRLTHQTQRVEESHPRTPEMVIYRPAAAANAAERRDISESERIQRPEQVWHIASEAPRARAAATPSVSIEQLTEHVIRQIDSRVIAMRERMGRI